MNFKNEINEYFMRHDWNETALERTDVVYAHWEHIG